MIKTEQRLFIGIYPGGIVYADKQREKNGDYLRLAFLSYCTLVIQWDKNEMPPELRAQILADVERMQAMRGQPFKISACGQSVILGKIP